MSFFVSSDRKLHNKPTLGLLLMALGLALYPISDAFIKYLMENYYPVHQTSFLRALSRLAPLLLATFFQGGPKEIFMTKHVGLHLIRLVVSLAYTYTFMYAFSVSSLTAVYTLGYTAPIFMVILSALILKENVGYKRWLAVIIGILGVLIALHPSSDITTTVVLVVLAGAFLSALNKILMRRLAETEHSLAIAIYPNVVMVLATLPFLITTWQPMPLAHWGIFAFIGVICAIGQYAITQALRYAQTSILAPIDYSTFIWVVLLDYIWWNKSLDAATFIGATIIVGCNLYIFYYTHAKKI